jgi:hypothetical protein
MPGKYGSASFAVLLVDGYNLLAAKVKGFAHKVTSIAESTIGLGDGTTAKGPTGIVEVTLSQEGAFFDDSTNNSHDALKSSTAVSRVLCFAIAGNAIGQPFRGVGGDYTLSYEVIAKNGTLTKANVTHDAGGALDRGTILQHHTPKTVDWNTKTLGTPVDYTLDPGQTVIPITSSSVANPSVITTPVAHGLTTGQKILISGHAGSTPAINGQQTVTVTSSTTFTIPVNVTVGGTGGSFVLANTVNGGAGYQQVSAFSGFTGFIGKIRSSADDVTYADLITFTNVTAAPAAERKTVTGTVDRYLCFDGDVTGAGSITPFAGFARS